MARLRLVLDALEARLPRAHEEEAGDELQELHGGGHGRLGGARSGRGGAGRTDPGGRRRIWPVEVPWRRSNLQGELEHWASMVLALCS